MNQSELKEQSYTSNFADVYGSKIHYLEAGEGDAILFLHGVPTSSHVWRKLFPHLSTLGRCIAPDLIGFGKSDKPNIEYTIYDHIKYIEKFIEDLQLKNIIFVMQGWGTLVGCDYATRHEKNCKGLVFYEGFLKSIGNTENSLPFFEQLGTLLSQEDSASLSTNGVAFVDKILAQRSLAPLSEEDLKVYREPFMSSGSAKPILQYIRELPKGDGKSEIDKVMAEHSMKLSRSQLPKLMLYSIPGFITTIAMVMWAKENYPNLEAIEVGEEMHFAQVTNSDLMGEAISVWLQGLEQYS